MPKFFVMLIVFGFLAAAAAPLTGAAEIEGVTFEERIRVDGEDLQLRGTALLKHLIVIKAYVGALYLPKETAAAKVLSNVPKALILHYFHEIPADDFARATTKMIEKNVDEAEFQKLKPRIEQMNALYRTVSPGDEYQAAYIPGSGTSLALNGERLGVVPGEEFARAYFAMWLGKNPISKSFRDRLLGR
ncbi:MAG: chalcone isomerase family protein [Desulfobacterales bacterium]